MVACAALAPFAFATGIPLGSQSVTSNFDLTGLVEKDGKYLPLNAEVARARLARTPRGGAMIRGAAMFALASIRVCGGAIDADAPPVRDAVPAKGARSEH